MGVPRHNESAPPASVERSSTCLVPARRCPSACSRRACYGPPRRPVKPPPIRKRSPRPRRSRPNRGALGVPDSRAAPAPRGQGAQWVRNPIDGSSWRGSRRWASSPPRRPTAALIRRVTFDLTGLPPTPEEVEAFLADARPDAYERLVDRLLAVPLRRALGPALARPGALRRLERLRARRRPARRLAVSRLGRGRAQRRHALRPVRRRCSSPATRSIPATRRP